MATDLSKSITVVAQPGPLKIFVDEVPGEEYLCGSGLQQNSPTNECKIACKGSIFIVYERGVWCMQLWDEVKLTVSPKIG
jgi:hypothetical protein